MRDPHLVYFRVLSLFNIYEALWELSGLLCTLAYIPGVRAEPFKLQMILSAEGN